MNSSTTVPELLDRSARSPSWVAFYGRGDSYEQVSFSDIWGFAQHAGGELTRRCGQRGAVAMLLAPSPACLVSLFGAWSAGLRVASLPHPARGATPDDYLEQIRRSCQLAGAETLLAEREHLALMPEELGIATAPFDEVAWSSTRPVSDTPGEFVQFTGGTTGAPKGVVLSSEAIASNVQAIIDRVPLPPGAVACSWLPLSHDMGLIGMCLAVICTFGEHANATSGLALMSPESFLASPLRWLRLIDQLRAVITCAPNFAFELCSRRIKATTALDLSSLEVLITGAEPVRASSLRRFTEAVVSHGFRPEAISPAYGLAEVTLAASIVDRTERWSSRQLDLQAIGEGRWTEAPDGTEIVACGTPLKGMSVRVDPGCGSDVGQLEICGPSLLTEYLGGETPDWHDGWFRTRDLGAVVDEQVYVLGRVDDVILVAGRKLYASDLEAVVDGHNAVRSGNCAVTSDHDGRYVVFAEPARSLDTGALEEASQDIRVALSRRFGVGPAEVVFVERRSLPKTPSGKLRRGGLRDAVARDVIPLVHKSEFGRRAVQTR